MNDGKRITVEQQLAELEQLGIGINSSCSVNDLFQMMDREEMEQMPYLLLLIALGCEAERQEGSLPLSHQIRYLDMECIEGCEDYVRIVNELCDMSELAVQQLRDQVDIYNGEASVTLEWNGRKFHWDLEVNDDWLDLAVFTNFSRLLEQAGDRRRIAVAEVDQHCLVACLTPDQVNGVNALLKPVTPVSFTCV